MLLYLDTSTIVKRYVKESGSDLISEIYEKTLNGDALLSFSAWNISEVLGVLDEYRRRGWLSDDNHLKARLQFLGETLRFLRLKLLRIVPTKINILIQTWSLIERYQIYEADALQILSAKRMGAEKLYTGDEVLHKVALEEGVESEYVG